MLTPSIETNRPFGLTPFGLVAEILRRVAERRQQAGLGLHAILARDRRRRRRATGTARRSAWRAAARPAASRRAAAPPAPPGATSGSGGAARVRACSGRPLTPVPPRQRATAVATSAQSHLPTTSTLNVSGRNVARPPPAAGRSSRSAGRPCGSSRRRRSSARRARSRCSRARPTCRRSAGRPSACRRRSS